jgi:uncharacterized protein (TIGR04255 family)
MLFPTSPRVIYGKNPLIGVTCQFTFPAILRIGPEVPAAFQERVRQQYPVFEETRGMNLKIRLPPQIANAPNPPIRLGNASYQFIDDNSPNGAVWTVGLNQESLSLSTSKYERWEDFKDHLIQPLQAFVDIYAPAFFTRIGLRYQDVICRSHLGIEHMSWKELLNTHIAGMFLAVEDEGDIEHKHAQAVVKLDDYRKVLIQHGSITEKESLEQCYLIDNDIYTENRTEAPNVQNVLDSLNEASGRIFRWCITDPLHQALDPHPV